MEVSSALTGRRGVSLPFTDVCPGLKLAGTDSGALYEAAVELGRERRWRYLECRDRGSDWAGSTPSVEFYGHEIFFEGGPEKVFGRLSSAARRGVEKARKSGVQIEFGNDLDAMQVYYRLHCATRRRHGIPPQPWRFFEEIAGQVLAQERGIILNARLQGRAVAGAVFFHQRGQAIYKFGALDYRFQQARPANLVMWEALQWYSTRGFSSMHLGRTSKVNAGLRRFKQGLGGVERSIEYARFDLRKNRFVTDRDRAESWMNALFRRLPVSWLRLAGAFLYPHLS